MSSLQCPVLKLLQAKIEAKNFVLSVEEELTSGPFIKVGTAALLLFIIWLVTFQNSRDSIYWFSTLAGPLVQSYTLHFPERFLQRQTTPFLAIVIEVVLVIYGCSAFKGEPGLAGWLVGFCWNIFAGIKLTIPERIRSEMRAKFGRQHA